MSPTPGAAPKIYRCPIEVRGYELDSYRHVNHAVYLHYFEHARWKLLEEEGVTLASFNQWKVWPVIGKIEVTYLRPVFMLDQLEVQTRIIEFGRASIQFDQKLVRSKSGQKTETEVLVTQALVKNVMVDENGRPSPMPEELKIKWQNL